MAYEDKSAQAVTTLAFCEGPGHEPILFEGRANVSLEVLESQTGLIMMQGRIVPARGPTNFGTSPSAPDDGFA